MVRVSVFFVVMASFVSTILSIVNAFFLKKQFYPSVVYLTKSSTSMAVLYFQAAVLSYLVFALLRWLFFGQLRVAEVERAQERVWHTLMETCLAFTVFRDDFSPVFVVQFVVLFFVKAFHWLAEDRVDYMERSPVLTLLFHARILGIISLLSAIDSYFISHAFFTTLMRGAGAQIVFGFEYAVLLTMVAHMTINYILHLHDLRSPHPWENKAVYMLYAELLTSFLRCALYLAFAAVMMKMHTFPLFAIRPFYLTVRAFRKAVNDVILSRRAINAMNNLFPLATAQDLTENDNTCIICREEMTVESGAKKLPCNHIFHPNCLRSWFQRQQTCPTCRTDVLIQRRPNTVIPGQNQQPPQAQRVFAAPLPPFAHPFQFQFHFGAAQQQPQQLPPFINGGMAPPFGFAPPPFPPQFVPQQQQQQAQAHQTPPQEAPLANGSAGGQPQTGQGQQQQPPASSMQQQNEQNGGGTLPTSSANAQSQQQQQFPSGAYPFMPFGLLPPPPPFMPFPQPPLFGGLSDAEIVAMEGTERRAVEARIQSLRNISILLDAALLQFQQYLSIPPPGVTSIVQRDENSAQNPSTSTERTTGVTQRDENKAQSPSTSADRTMGETNPDQQQTGTET
uniref:E3 ubiquitin-protein ligase hrd-1 n=1 Tax=Globodera pallida TaxID=36090 RepID=A0A183BTK3_GLOPA